MGYPNTPFDDNFDASLIFKLNDGGGPACYDEVLLQNILRWLCTAPKMTCFRVNTLKYSVAQIKELLDFNFGTGRRVPVMLCPELPEVILIGSYPTEALDLSAKRKEVIVDCSCGAAVLRGAHVFAPGVMAMQHGTCYGDVVSVYADPQRACKKGMPRLYECPNKIFIGNGIVRMKRSDIFGENLDVTGVAVEMQDVASECPPFDVQLLPPQSGILQNVPSVVCGRALDPKPGETVLDMCAAPGNKTTHLAQLMNDQVTQFEGVLVAIDKTDSKHKRLRDKCDEFGLKCVRTHRFDSTRLLDANLDSAGTEPPFPRETFDKVLLDAPCSALGSRPQLSNAITGKILRSYVPLQRKLFENAVHLLKVGGLLTYSTCTITLGENEGIVAWALDKFDCLELEEAQPVLGGPGWPGTSLTDEQLRYVQRFGLNDRYDSIAFFICNFRKKTSCS